jgi:hypothetical protein
MDAPGLPSFHFDDGSKEEIAVVHSDFRCGFSPLSLMESAGWCPYRLHAIVVASGETGFANHGLTCLAINIMIA